MQFVLAAIVLAVIAATMRYSPHPWRDDSDCSVIVQHTVRVPSDIERLTMWYARYYIHVEVKV